MHYVDGTIVSGTKLKEEVDLQPGPGTAARLVNQVKNAAVGVFSHVDSQWTPSVIASSFGSGSPRFSCVEDHFLRFQPDGVLGKIRLLYYVG